jgi:diguanylate cyclase (GGDEF)-like protein/PAS domain S-box-containing protein
MGRRAERPGPEMRACVDESHRHREASFAVAFLLALVVTALAFLASRGLRSMAGQIAPIWLSNAVLLAQLIVARPRQRYWVFAGGVLGDLTANFLIGRSPHVAFAFMSADMLQVAISFAFSPRVSTVAELIRPKPLLRFLAGGVILAPVVSGLMATILLGGHVGNFLLPTLVPWFISDGLSLVIITPVAVAFWTGEVAQLFRSEHRLKTGLLLLLVCAVTAGVFAQGQFTLLYWVLPPIVLLAFQAEIAGVLVGLLLCLAMGLWFTVHGSGPLWSYRFDGMQSRIFALQCFFVATLGISLPISAIQAQRNRLITRLREGERQYRILAENATDVVMSLSVDGKLTYVSPRAHTVLGYSAENLIGAYYPDLVAPDDRDILATAIESVVTGESEASRISRFHRPDGKDLWLETHLRVVIDPFSGKPEALTATARDITERKFAEQRYADERKELQGLAYRDALTGLFNRRHFDSELKQQWQQEARAGNDGFVALIMIDVDAFKDYNDHYGHQKGDECLRTIAQTIASAARVSTDVVARYGGEEFALILKDIDREGSLAVAERIRHEVESLRIPHAASSAGIVTISLGVAAQRTGEAGDGVGLTAASDRALYSAKRLGRNQTCIAWTDARPDDYPLDLSG